MVVFKVDMQEKSLLTDGLTVILHYPHKKKVGTVESRMTPSIAH